MNSQNGSAYQHLQIINQEEKKRMVYEAREKAIRDYNQGILEAEARGEARGETRGEARINKLITLLAKDKRYDDLARSANDAAFQQQLMSEYGV